MIIENVDKLTGLYIQKYFEKRFQEELARTNRYKRPLTLVLFEINYNYFDSEFNVRWAMVYTILKQFGALLLRQLRNVDIAGRYGGDKFAVLLPETSIEGGKVAAERIRKMVAEYSFIGDNLTKEVRIAVNGGIATYPVHGKTVQELLSSAHQGLLIARKDGGNKIVECPQKIYNQEGVPLIYAEAEQEPEQPEEEKEVEEKELVEEKTEEELKEKSVEEAVEEEKPEEEETERVEKAVEEAAEETGTEEREEMVEIEEEKVKEKVEKKVEQRAAGFRDSLKEAIERKKAELRKALEAKLKSRSDSD